MLLVIFIFDWLCLYPDLSKASWYGVTESLKISSEDDNVEIPDSMVQPTVQQKRKNQHRKDVSKLIKKQFLKKKQFQFLITKSISYKETIS